MPDPANRHDWWPRLIRAWLVTGVTDGLFSSILNVAAYGSTVARLWQGVASVVIGPRALDGGFSTVALGILMHFGVALTWSAVFVACAMSSSRLRSVISGWRGIIAVAALYGPFVWVVMSFVVIPALTHRPPAINGRWWVQFVGHWPFVGLPIVGATASRSFAARSAIDR